MARAPTTKKVTCFFFFVPNVYFLQTQGDELDRAMKEFDAEDPDSPSPQLRAVLGGGSNQEEPVSPIQDMEAPLLSTTA